MAKVVCRRGSWICPDPIPIGRHFRFGAGQNWLIDLYRKSEISNSPIEAAPIESTNER